MNHQSYDQLRPVQDDHQWRCHPYFEIYLRSGFPCVKSHSQTYSMEVH
jgi:hypothetical protein